MVGEVCVRCGRMEVWGGDVVPVWWVELYGLTGVAMQIGQGFESSHTCVEHSLHEILAYNCPSI